MIKPLAALRRTRHVVKSVDAGTVSGLTSTEPGAKYRLWQKRK